MSHTNILMCIKNAKIISEEIIKPSSPTPEHLKTLKLCFLDQIATPVYVPVLLFYGPMDRKNMDPYTECSLLKQSLAETLTRYYPLAGTLRKNSHVDCDDVGVRYLECDVQCKLSDVISYSKPMHLHPLLPFEPYYNESSGFEREVLLAVKVTSFECGGLVIGVCVSHKLSDAQSTIMFLNDWAATCARADISARAQFNPIFDSAVYFPPNDLIGYKRSIPQEASGKTIATKRFIFDKSNILDLKNKATSPEVKRPSRVEAVSTFIWQRIMAITQPTKAFVAIQIVNLRPRMDPPLSTAFGNLWWRAMAMTSPSISNRNQLESTYTGPDEASSRTEDKKGDNYYPTLVNKMRNAIKQVDGEYIKTLQSDEGQVSLIKGMSGQVSRSDIGILSFTSWVGFPIYEVDFGRGKPSWAFSPIQEFQNMVMLTSTSDGEGIEAWVNLVDADMAALERDVEFLSKV